MASEHSSPLDANSRLKQRIRATVPPRDTSVLKKQQPPELATTPLPENLESTPPSSSHSQTETTPLEKKLVSFTLRVDSSVDKGLKSLCMQEDITKETFLEAAYLVCIENEQLRQQVLKVAQARRQERRETGILRRAKAMTRYLHS